MDVTKIRADFPILSRTVRDGKPLVYLDSGATSQRPRQVLDAERAFLEQHNAAVHRGRAPARRGGHRRLRGGAGAHRRVRRRRPRRGGVHQERHRGRQPRRLRVLQRGRVRRARRSGSCSGRATRSSSPSWSTTPTSCRGRSCAAARGPRCAGTPSPTRAGSTSTRSSSPSAPRSWRSPTSPTCSARCCRWPSWCARAKAVGALTLLDACQSVPHMPVHFGELDVDFAVFSGHKMLGPSGVGVLYGRRRAARRDAAVPHRRLDDRDGADGGLHLRRATAAVRGGRADDVAGRRAGRGRRLPHRHRHGRRARARARAGRAGARRAVGGAGRAHHRAARHWSTGAGRWRSSSTGSTPTTSGRCSTTGASRCGWGTTARGRCTGASASPPPCGRRSTCTRRPRRSTRWWTPCARPGTFSE